MRPVAGALRVELSDRVRVAALPAASSSPRRTPCSSCRVHSADATSGHPGPPPTASVAARSSRDCDGLASELTCPTRATVSTAGLERRRDGIVELRADERLPGGDRRRRAGARDVPNEHARVRAPPAARSLRGSSSCAAIKGSMDERALRARRRSRPRGDSGRATARLRTADPRRDSSRSPDEVAGDSEARRTRSTMSTPR